MINSKKTKQKFGYLPEELTPMSSRKIIITCDYCQKDVEKTMSGHNRQNKKSLIKKDCCNECRGTKLAEIHILF